LRAPAVVAGVVCGQQMVAVVNFETKRRGFCPRRWSGPATLAVLASALVAPVAEAQDLTSLRFLPSGFTINGQPPAVFFERDAEQILNAQVSYEVDYGYEGGDVLFVRAEPFGANPATLTPGSGSPRCSTATMPANVDLALQNPAWAPDGAATRHVAAPFVLDEEPDQVPPPQPRSFGFSFGTLCQDSEEEPAEQFRLTLWFQPDGVGVHPDPIKYPVLQYLVRIIDETAEPGLSGDLEVTETDEDAVALLALPVDGEAAEARCYPYRIAYSRSTAGREDARLVGSDGRSPVAFGTFVAQPRSTTAVSSNLLVVGDDLIEGDETLHLDLYAPGSAGDVSCSPAGAPVTSVVVIIADDDLPLGIASLEIDGAPDGIHREGDSGETASVHLIVRFERRLTEPVTLRYGSVADAEARGSEPKQDVETVSERSVTVAVGQIAVRVRVATIVGDDRVEAVEHFSVWAAVDEYSAESKMWLRVGIANDDVPGDRILEVVLEGEGVEGGSILEGDPDTGGGGGECQREWKCVFLILGLTGDRQSKDVVYQVHTVAGSARPGEDYRFRDGVRVRLDEGHLRTFDVQDPLQLQVRRDFFVEGEREDLFLVVHMLAGDESPLFSWYERIEIVDDDRLGGSDGALWFGVAEGEDGLASCPLPSRPVLVAEPLDGGVRAVRLDLVMAERGSDQKQPQDGEQGAQQRSCQPAVGKPVTEYRYELRSGAAEVGRDVLGSAGAGGVVRFVSGRAAVDFGIVGDGQMEGREDLTLALFSGAGTVALFTVVVEDAESVRETVSSRTASAVRIGRVLGAEVSDVLAERFSCAGSPACARAGAPAEAQLWPGGRSGPSVSPASLLRRLAWSAGSVGMPALAPPVVPVGGGLPSPDLHGPGLYGSGLPGPGGGLDVMGAGAGPGHYGAHGASRPVDEDRLAVVGRAFDGLRYQGDPGRWLGPLNVARGDHRRPAWTFWARSSYGVADDTSSTARRLRTSMLSMTGGLDRQVGRFRVGVLYTHAFVQSEADLHGQAQEFVPADPVQGSSWRVVAPYVGWIPHRRFRLWVSPGWVTGGGGAAPGEGLDASMRMVVSGASVSVYSSREVSADIEADVFEVDVDRTPAVSEQWFGMPEDAFAGRAQRARLAGRLGFPLGDPAASASRLAVRLGRRWDVGTDIDWVWGPIARRVSWKGAGQVSATDLLVDLRYSRVRSSLSLVLTLGAQLGGEEPQVAGERVGFSSRRQIAFGGGLLWGAAGSGKGWSASLRPSYGHVSAAMPGWWNGAVPRLGAPGGFEVAPVVDAEVGYGFEDGGRVSVSSRRAFGGGHAGAGRLGAVLRYGRGW
jgi:hypothetical protein